MTDNELLTERFGPLPQRTPGAEVDRSWFLDAMQAVIAFFTDNPDVPLPIYMSLHCAARDAEHVEELAAAFGKHTYGGVRRQFDYRLAELAPHPGHVQVLVSAPAAEDRPL